jgi:hypothetical protein
VNSDVHGLASGQKPSQARPHRPSQAKPKVLAWSWLWLGFDFLKAKANGPGHGFEHYFLEQLPPIIMTLTVAQQAPKSKFLTYPIAVDHFWTDPA